MLNFENIKMLGLEEFSGYTEELVRESLISEYTAPVNEMNKYKVLIA